MFKLFVKIYVVIEVVKLYDEQEKSQEINKTSFVFVSFIHVLFYLIQQSLDILFIRRSHTVCWPLRIIKKLGKFCLVW